MITETEVAPRMVSALPVPRVDVPAAREAALRLREVAHLAASSQAVVEQARVDSWSGTASTSYYELRGRAVGRLDTAAGFARDLSTAVDHYADTVQPAVVAMRRAATDLDLALAQRATAADEAAFHATQSPIDDAYARHRTAQAEYDAAVSDLRARLAAVPRVPDEPRTLTQHTADGLRRLWRDAVSDPVAGVHLLALGWVDDPAGWRSMVTGIPAGLWDQATHPRRTLDQLLAGEDWRNGQYGAAVGTALSMAAVPVKALKAVASSEIRTRYARNMADPDAPRPRVQTVDEMLARVDLAAHEHHALGHAVRRHVDVDDDYLRDRLDNGTLLDDGTRGGRPPHASAWNDLETAETAIAAVLRQHEAALRSLSAGDVKQLPELKAEFPQSLGRVMSRDGQDVVVRGSGKVNVRVGIKNGQVFIVSAFLEAP